MDDAGQGDTRQAGNGHKIHPCPFSQGYGIPAAQAWRLIKIFLGYRLVLAGLFLFVRLAPYGSLLLEMRDERLLTWAVVGYGGAALLAFFAALLWQRGYSVQAQGAIFIDILFLTLIMHACGGVASGLGMLLAVPTAAGGMLIGGRCSMLFAALASLAVLAEQIYQAQTYEVTGQAFTYSGVLGAAFFTIALLSYILAGRTEQSETLARAHRKTIVTLEELSQSIIQHLQSGLIIVDHFRHITLLNQTAYRLLQFDAKPDNLSALPDPLAQAFGQWLLNAEQDFVLFKMANGMELTARFSELPTRHALFHMILIEDSARHNQRLQQAKLASLGRLTASIAHEIRNPLSALAHASQLLSESSGISEGDRRLTEIIAANVKRMDRIIEDILQLSRRKAARRERIRLDAWLADYVARFIAERDLPPARCRLENAASPLWVWVDPDHLKQILDNLCQNALRYGLTANGMLRVRLIDSEKPCIEIIDDGPGIEPDHAEHLFEPFFTTSPQGTGLGLYISRELAELNHARLSYVPGADGGSCFRLCLQRAGQESG